MKEYLAYEDVPYIGGVYPQSHVAVLATVARLLGMHPAPVERCRVLEIGCADGANLIGMAAHLPQSDFVGVDGSEKQLARGHALRAQGGLHNLSFVAKDLRDLSDELGTFDYIIAHGVFSWVAADARVALLQQCKRLLRPQGVAYISYNTWPGWHSKSYVRGLMRFSTRNFIDPERALEAGRTIVEVFGSLMAGVQGRILRDAAAFLRGADDDYVYHDYLEENNAPILFHAFLDAAQRAGLQYIGDAEPHRSLDLNLPDTTRAALSFFTDDPIVLEQYLDFLTDRDLRRTLLCHDDVVLRRTLDAETLAALFVRVPLTDRQKTPNGDLVFRRPGDPDAAIVAQAPLHRAVLDRLVAVYPSAIRIGDLSAALRVDRDSLIELLSACFLRGFAELDVSARRIPSAPVEPPWIHPLARAQAAAEQPVTSALHQGIAVKQPAHRHAIVLADGTRDIEAIAQVLGQPVETVRVLFRRLWALGLVLTPPG